MFDLDPPSLRTRRASDTTATRLRAATVVITGGSSGIGRATAEAFAREGARVVIAARDIAAAEEVAAACRGYDVPALAIAADVTDIASIANLADTAIEFGGAIDIWVSNVGVGAVGLYHETPMEAHEKVIRANLIGHMNDAHVVVPHFIAQGRGTFINMISLGAFAATPFAVAYSASKFGLKGFSEALRGELSSYRDIHVCDIYPAFIDTPGLSHAANYTGRKLGAPPPVFDPRKVAEAIVATSRSPRHTVVVGWFAHALRMGHAVAPHLTAKAAAFGLGMLLRLRKRVPVTEGNLYEPQAETRIDAGLRGINVKTAVVVGAVVVVGGLLWGRLRRSA